MKKNLLTRCLIICFLLMSSSLSAQEVALLFPTEVKSMFYPSDSLNCALDSVPKRMSLKERFKKERNNNQQARQHAAKYYNPLTLIYRILGL